jgi:hypothetical protein
LSDLDQHYQKTSSIVSREIAGEVILVPIRNNVGDLDSIYTLNETGARIWELIEPTRPARAIGDHLVQEFEVEEEEARADLIELLDQLLSIGAIEQA